MSNIDDENLKLEKDEKLNPVIEYVKEMREENQKKDEKIPEEARPDYLLPQFKNIEEQAKSYKELQGLQTKQAQELAKYKKTEELNKKRASVAEVKMQNEEQRLKRMYLDEVENIKLAVSTGKITPNEAKAFAVQLKTFVLNKLKDVANNYNQDSLTYMQSSDVVSPKEFFAQDIKERNYLEPISEFLEKNYKKLSKPELEAVKNLVLNLENSLREEILKEKVLNGENENYRKNLNSATNLISNSNNEKVYTLEEIKKMKPEEFRKNQKAILEQFVARKIK